MTRLIVTIILFILLMWNIATAQPTEADLQQNMREDRIIKFIILMVPVVIGVIMAILQLFKSDKPKEI